jgi:hypothetical protein
MKPTFRRCLQKNNIFPVIVFGELFENLQLLSTETSGNGCWKVSMKAKLKTVGYFQKHMFEQTRQFSEKNDSMKNCEN